MTVGSAGRIGVVSRALGIVAVAFFLHASPLDHHSFAAEYDASKVIELKGTIVKMDWVNPHSWLYIEVKKPDGTAEMWAIEFGTPNTLYRHGWRPDMLPVGQAVTVSGFAAKNASHTANARDVTLADGKKLFAGSSDTGAPYDAK